MTKCRITDKNTTSKMNSMFMRRVDVFEVSDSSPEDYNVREITVTDTSLGCLKEENLLLRKKEYILRNMSKLEDLEILQRENDDLLDRVNQLQHSEDFLKCSIKQIESALLQYESENIDLSAKERELENLSKVKQREIENLRAQVGYLRSQVDKAHEALTDKDEEIQQRASQKQVELKTLKKELISLQKHEVNLNKENTLLTVELTEVKSVLQELSKDNNELKAAVQDLQDQVMKDQKIITEQNMEISDNRQIMEERYEIISDLKRSLADLKSQQETRQEEEMLTLQAELHSSLAQEHDVLRTSSEESQQLEAQREIENLREQVCCLQSQVDKALDALTFKDKEKSGLSSQSEAEMIGFQNQEEVLCEQIVMITGDLTEVKTVLQKLYKDNNDLKVAVQDFKSHVMKSLEFIMQQTIVIAEKWQIMEERYELINDLRKSLTDLKSQQMLKQEEMLKSLKAEILQSCALDHQQSEGPIKESNELQADVEHREHLNALVGQDKKVKAHTEGLKKFFDSREQNRPVEIFRKEPEKQESILEQYSELEISNQWLKGLETTIKLPEELIDTSKLTMQPMVLSEKYTEPGATIAEPNKQADLSKEPQKLNAHVKSKKLITLAKQSDKLRTSAEEPRRCEIIAKAAEELKTPLKAEVNRSEMFTDPADSPEKSQHIKVPAKVSKIDSTKETKESGGFVKQCKKRMSTTEKGKRTRSSPSPKKKPVGIPVRTSTEGSNIPLDPKKVIKGHVDPLKDVEVTTEKQMDPRITSKHFTKSISPVQKGLQLQVTSEKKTPLVISAEISKQGPREQLTAPSLEHQKWKATIEEPKNQEAHEKQHEQSHVLKVCEDPTPERAENLRTPLLEHSELPTEHPMNFNIHRSPAKQNKKQTIAPKQPENLNVPLQAKVDGAVEKLEELVDLANNKEKFKAFAEENKPIEKGKGLEPSVGKAKALVKPTKKSLEFHGGVPKQYKSPLRDFSKLETHIDGEEKVVGPAEELKKLNRFAEDLKHQVKHQELEIPLKGRTELANSTEEFEISQGETEQLRALSENSGEMDTSTESLMKLLEEHKKPDDYEDRQKWQGKRTKQNKQPENSIKKTGELEPPTGGPEELKGQTDLLKKLDVPAERPKQPKSEEIETQILDVTKRQNELVDTVVESRQFRTLKDLEQLKTPEEPNDPAKRTKENVSDSFKVEILISYPQEHQPQGESINESREVDLPGKHHIELKTPLKTNEKLEDIAEKTKHHKSTAEDFKEPMDTVQDPMESHREEPEKVKVQAEKHMTLDVRVECPKDQGHFAKEPQKSKTFRPKPVILEEELGEFLAPAGELQWLPQTEKAHEVLPHVEVEARRWNNESKTQVRTLTKTMIVPQESEEFPKEQDNRRTAVLTEVKTVFVQKINKDNSGRNAGLQDQVIKAREIITQQYIEIADEQQVRENGHDLTGDLKKSLPDLKRQKDIDKEETPRSLQTLRLKIHAQERRPVEAPARQRVELEALVGEPEEVEYPAEDYQQQSRNTGESEDMESCADQEAADQEATSVFRAPFNMPWWCHYAKCVLKVGLPICSITFVARRMGKLLIPTACMQMAADPSFAQVLQDFLCQAHQIPVPF